MADSIQFELDRDFSINGQTIPGNTRLNSEDLRGMLKNAKGQPLSSEEATATAQDLLASQKRHNEYMKGIHEKREIMGNAGTIAMGSGAE